MKIEENKVGWYFDLESFQSVKAEFDSLVVVESGNWIYSNGEIAIPKEELFNTKDEANSWGRKFLTDMKNFAHEKMIDHLSSAKELGLRISDIESKIRKTNVRDL